MAATLKFVFGPPMLGGRFAAAGLKLKDFVLIISNSESLSSPFAALGGITRSVTFLSLLLSRATTGSITGSWGRTRLFFGFPYGISVRSDASKGNAISPSEGGILCFDCPIPGLGGDKGEIEVSSSILPSRFIEDCFGILTSKPVSSIN
ncbi:hypothetical protein V8G54_020537 [Vigna mungo]|uniref:Uncharacterized protein n=1 Tax=Vigna mungo TaxID=3915 RepID=A0AAQ3NDU1_VIGMU